jgi:1,2-diacylglycerol 3-beta-glucosyltransferase
VLAGALELFLVSLGLTYYVATVGAGLRVIRRARKARREQAALAAAAAGPASLASGSGRAARSGSGTPSGPGARSGSRRRPAPHRAVRGVRGVSAARGLDPAAARGAGVQGSGPAADLAATVSAGWGRLRTRLETADEPAARAGLVVPPEDCVVYFLIPCLNEELVIGDTVRSLLADSRGLVVVVDDGSDDRTAELAAAAGGDRAMVVRRELPDARRGKGPALNVGFAEVLHDAGVRGIPASRITVCVMDADGRLSEGALDVVLPLFEDPRVGGVQLPVRIRNRTSLLTVMQDLEFWGVCAVAQLGRMACGTVSLGGNGQFTRLAALLEMGPAPWQAQLTEDLDLSLALAAKGWRLTSAPDAHVSQQGVTSLRALVNQRTRWYQGHMQAVRWLRELWTSRQLSHLAMLELTIYLLVPWALVLPWSIIFNYNLLIMILWVLGWVATPGLGSDLTQKIATLAFWYMLSCLPIYMAGFLYGRQERKVGYIRAFFIGHLLLVGNYVTYAACWRAMYRLITGAHGWEKTRRTDERPAAAPVRVSPAPALAASARPAVASAAIAGAVPALAASAFPAVARPAVLAAVAPYPAVPTGVPLDYATLDVTALDVAAPDVAALRRPAAGPGLMARVPWPRRAARAESYADSLPDWIDQDATTTDLPVITAPPEPPAASTAGTGEAWVRGPGTGEAGASGPGTGDAWAGDPGTGGAWADGPATGDAWAGGPGIGDAWAADRGTGDAWAGDPGTGDAWADGPGTGDAWADGPGTGDAWAGVAWAREAWATDPAAGRAWADDTGNSRAAMAGDGPVRDQPPRRPGSRSGHGQSRRVAGSHRAGRARPAQHSGR